MELRGKDSKITGSKWRALWGDVQQNINAGSQLGKVLKENSIGAGFGPLGPDFNPFDALPNHFRSQHSLECSSMLHQRKGLGADLVLMPRGSR